MTTAHREPSRVMTLAPLIAPAVYLLVVARLISWAVEEGVNVDGGFASGLAMIATLPWSLGELLFYRSGNETSTWVLVVYAVGGLINAALIYGAGRFLMRRTA